MILIVFGIYYYKKIVRKTQFDHFNLEINDNHLLPQKFKTFTVISDHIPKHPSDLSVKVGDIVVLQENLDEHLYKVYNIHTNEDGYLPAYCLLEISD